MAVAATGVPVLGGVLEAPPTESAASDTTSYDRTTTAAAAMGRASLAERAEQVVSRSDSRAAADRDKAAALSQAGGPAMTRSEDLSEADPRDIARALMPQFGFSADQFSCLDSLYISESDWRVDADNPTSSAYGIPQALTSMHELPADYMTSAEAQIRWGLDYIADSYGSPCAAWEFKQANNWY
ncbi:MAG TPA: lytic transglycosylase domain-containing protein [Nocardioides sp.]|nr:lytic transglycosylase domain-containing protein [Nocardioides sp.]